MSKRSTTQVGRQMEMLPLEKWLAAERTRSNAMRPLGDVVADVVKKVGRPHTAGGDSRETGPIRDAEVTPRKEDGNDELDRLMGSDGPLAVTVLHITISSGAEHQTCSSCGTETWIPF